MDQIKQTTFREAGKSDKSAIWAVIGPTIRDGRTYGLDSTMDESAAITYWTAADKRTFVAIRDGQVVGTYYIRSNQGGGGSHVANCGYMTLGSASGQGIARAMCLHSLDVARASGYRAMQFNFVVSTNTRAVKLWEQLGFEIVGRLPGAFKLPTSAYVDALVLFQTLSND